MLNFSRQRAKAKWLKEGDKNIHFFHVSASIERNKSKLFRIQNSEGVWLTDQIYIAEPGVQYYQNLFRSDQNSFDYPLIQQFILTLINEDQNSALIKVPDMEEIKAVVFSMNPEGQLALMDLEVCFILLVGRLLNMI